MELYSVNYKTGKSGRSVLYKTDGDARKSAVVAKAMEGFNSLVFSVMEKAGLDETGLSLEQEDGKTVALFDARLSDAFERMKDGRYKEFCSALYEAAEEVKRVEEA